MRGGLYEDIYLVNGAFWCSGFMLFGVYAYDTCLAGCGYWVRYEFEQYFAPPTLEKAYIEEQR